MVSDVTPWSNKPRYQHSFNVREKVVNMEEKLDWQNTTIQLKFGLKITLLLFGLFVHVSVNGLVFKKDSKEVRKLQN